MRLERGKGEIGKLKLEIGNLKFEIGNWILET